MASNKAANGGTYFSQGSLDSGAPEQQGSGASPSTPIPSTWPARSRGRCYTPSSPFSRKQVIPLDSNLDRSKSRSTPRSGDTSS